uniref:YubB ferredoxin-like domain-containing protein n=1 Tax=Bacteroides uniformis TaxID=820 RepID=A4VC28_BACUN|nr:hypothetical protein bst098 [Bacteroides uniformis]
MPNWCSTAYVIDGDAKEVKQLYELMKGLEERKTPSVENGFGTTWLGCLVDALGKDWNDVRCRGSWNGLEMDGDVLKFSTETAWAPCSETFDLVREAFPNLRYYFQAEETGMEVYETNDEFGHISVTGSSWTHVPQRKSISVNISRPKKMRSLGLKKNAESR